MTEFELFQALRPLYPSREYALMPQVANGTGSQANRHADALALSLWPSRGLHLYGFEIKSYRGDWIRELRNPEKAEEIAQYCNQWWIVAAASVVRKDEVPEGWGLMEWDLESKSLKKSKQAPTKKASQPDLPFVAAMLRKAQDVVTPEAIVAEAYRKGYSEGESAGKVTTNYEVRDYRALREKVQEFEKASGIKISGWVHPKEIGEAVNLVLNGTTGKLKSDLIRVANRIRKELGEVEVD